ncbi:6672_t:CDS:2, partial [Acaulospora morrowiae]
LAATKPKLPNFWLPSLTPSADPDKIKSVKLQTMCTVSDPEHPISVKNLIPTKFTEVKDPDSKKINFVCPSCRRTLTNSIKICLMKPCGHVICKICVEKFIKNSKKCFVCDVKCKEKDITDMSGEGTGFASGGGKVVAERFDVAFQ